MNFKIFLNYKIDAYFLNLDAQNLYLTRSVCDTQCPKYNKNEF